MAKFSIVCVTGTREKLQMAAMFASVAAASGDEVSVFLSMNALPYFIKGHGSEAPSEGEMGLRLRQKGVPSFKQLFQQAVELGDTRILPCSMAMDLLKITSDDMDREIGPPTGLTRFISDTADGQILTF